MAKTGKNGIKKKHTPNGHEFTSDNQPSGEAKSLGKAKAKTQRELQAMVREKVFAEFFRRDLSDYTNKELNQLVGTVWTKDDTEEKENNAPVINFVENLDEEEI